MTTLANMTREWDLAGDVPFRMSSFSEAQKYIEYFYETHYYQYIPTLSPQYLDFEMRLEQWLENTANKEERQLLLEIAVNLAFFSREDFAKLHLAAFQGPIMRWLIDALSLRFDSPGFQDSLRVEAENHTWYCPITDSMQINDFHHANSLGGIDHRPDWRSLAQFGDPARIQDYMHNRLDAWNNPAPLRRIVLLEDFIGSGTQMTSAINFIKRFPSTLPVLLLPLLVCPAGAREARNLAATHPNVQFAPVIEFKSADMITELEPRNGSFPGKVADFAETSYADVVGDDAQAPRPYDPFGFRGTGSLVVLYSNTPANTLPLVQHQSSDWQALFPRSARIR